MLDPLPGFLTTTQEIIMQFVNGIIYGSGFMFGATLVAVAMRAVFHMSVCG